MVVQMNADPFSQRERVLCLYEQCAGDVAAALGDDVSERYSEYLASRLRGYGAYSERESVYVCMYVYVCVFVYVCVALTPGVHSR